MEQEKSIHPLNGYMMLGAVLILLGVSVYMLAVYENLWFIAGLAIAVFALTGFAVVNPNQSLVNTLFGTYVGTIKVNGFYWINPFYVRKKISLRARNFDSQTIKVNDRIGNPIMIGLVLVWKVENTYKAAFSVDNYEQFVLVQSEAALRKLAGIYSYDNIENDHDEVTLRAGGEEVNSQLEDEISRRLEIAGIYVIEARINHLAYAQEIAQAMLKRQQATAIVAARHKIVEGAVSMVEMALSELSKKQIVDLDEAKKATMVSNLMVVLCSDKDASPVVNTGSVY
jgi:hypothetical protein